MIWDLQRLNKKLLDLSAEEMLTAYEKLTPLLQGIDYTIADAGSLVEIIGYIADYWWFYYSEVNSDTVAGYTKQCSGIIKKILYSLESKANPLTDSRLLRICALILVKDAFGNQFEVKFDQQLSMAHLLAFSSLRGLHPNLNHVGMNEIIGINLIQVHGYQLLIDRFNQFLSQPDINQVAPGLDFFKTRPNKLGEQQTFDDFSVKAKEILNRLSKNRHGLFAAKNAKAEQILHYLANQQFNELSEFLQDNSPKPNRNCFSHPQAPTYQ